jgi:hypothetical protein
MTTVGPAWSPARHDVGVAVRAPWWPVAATAVVSALAIAFAAVSAFVLETVSFPLVISGYVLGAMVTTALAATYRALRNARRRHPRFRVQRGLDRAAAVAMGVGFVAGLVNAGLLATELAK